MGVKRRERARENKGHDIGMKRNGREAERMRNGMQ